MIEVTNHAYERYCERVLGMTQMEVRAFLTQPKKEELKLSIADMFDRSTWVYTGKYMDNSSSGFYLFDDLLFVCNTSGNAIITLYYVEFGFSRNTNKKVIDDLMAEVQELHEEKQREEPFIAELVGELDTNIALCNAKLESLNAQIKLIEEQKRGYEYQKNTVGNGLKILNEKINNIASKICYSVNYKADSLVRK